MLEQYNILQKLFRLAVFIILVYLSFTYLPSQDLTHENKIKLIAAVAIIFLIYELYYPSVRIEPTPQQNY